MSEPTPAPGLSADVVNTILRALGHDPARVTNVEITKGKILVTSVTVHDLVDQAAIDAAQPQSAEGTTDGGNEPDDGEQPEPAKAPAPRRAPADRKKAGK